MCQSGKDKVFLLPEAVFQSSGGGEEEGKKERESLAVVCHRYQ